MTEDFVALADGARMPLLGIGTWRASGDECYQAVLAALEIGYRHIDTATMYGNEQQVGRAIRDSSVPRAELFVTTKLQPGDAGREQRTVEQSLTALGLEYVDLWLIHWPPNGSASVRVWAEFLKIQAAGQVRSVGVSNYSTGQIDALTRSSGVTPTVNQIPWSPWQYDARVLADSKQRGVVVEGYSPFKGSKLGHPVLAEIAAAHGVTPARVVLRWHLEHRVVVIPKSVRRERIASNFDIFDFALSPEEVARIDALG